MILPFFFGVYWMEKKIYRAFGFSYSAYIEVEVPKSSPFPVSEKEIQNAQDILDSTLHKLFGTHKLSDNVTVCLCGVTKATNDYVVFEEKKEDEENQT